jgi:hypothetical protein
MKLSEAQQRVVDNIRAGRNPGDGFGSGAYAGQPASQAVTALLRKKVIKSTGADIGPAYTLTPLGQRA